MTLRTLAVALLLCSARSDDSAATVDSTDANFNTESAEDDLAWDEMDSDLAWDDIDEVEADPATVRALFERLDASGDGRLDVAELQAALESQGAQLLRVCPRVHHLRDPRAAGRRRRGRRWDPLAP